MVNERSFFKPAHAANMRILDHLELAVTLPEQMLDAEDLVSWDLCILPELVANVLRKTRLDLRGHQTLLVKAEHLTL